MKYIVGNWKMNLGIRESVALARGVLRSLRGKEATPEVVLCPSFTALSEVRKVLARSRVSLGAQTCGIERSGSYTGDVSVAQLEDVSCTYAIVGHSERRNGKNETDEVVRKKFSIAMESKLTPILCVGEPANERKNGSAKDFVQGQLAAALDGLKLPNRKSLMIAYEPIWAIGTGEPADVQDVLEMHEFIREEAKCHVPVPDDRLVVLYGGSIDGDNAYQFLRENQVDGLLVGGASLKLQAFSDVLKAGVDVIQAQK